MGQPFKPSSAHTDRALANLVDKRPSDFAYIAADILNVYPTDKESDVFYKLDAAALVNHQARVKRAPGGESSEVEFSWTTDSFRCEERALHTDLPLEAIRNADTGLDLEAEAAATAREGVLLAREIDVRSLVMGSGVSSTAASATWNNATKADIKIWQDVIGAKHKVRTNGGASPDHIAMGHADWQKVAKYVLEVSSSGSASGVRWAGTAALMRERPDEAPEMFVGLRLLVGDAVHAGTSVQHAAGVTETSTTDVWTAGTVLVFRKGRPGVKSRQFGIMPQQNGFPRVRKGDYAGPREARWYEYCTKETYKLVAANFGHRITTT